VHNGRVGEGAAHVHAHQGAFRGSAARLYHRAHSTQAHPSSREPPVRTVLAVAAALTAAAVPAAAIPALVAPPGGLLPAAPAELSPGPPNGDLSAGLEGWDAQGREPPASLAPAPGVRLRANTTLVSPPLVIPAGAQSLLVTARAPAAEALLEVRARPVEGGAEIPLGTLEPGATARARAVGVAALAGRAVRIVLDPVPALGASLDILGVGPLVAPLPGWTVIRGALEPAGVARRRSVRVADGVLELRSPAFAPGPAARELIVAVRGEGFLRLAAGGRAVTARASATWRDVRVPVRPGRRALRLVADPAAAGLELRDLGLVRRGTVIRGLSATRSGARVAVRGRLGPAGGGLLVELRDPRGRRLGRARSSSSGAFTVRGRTAATRIAVAVTGDRTRVGARRGLALR